MTTSEKRAIERHRSRSDLPVDAADRPRAHAQHAAHGLFDHHQGEPGFHLRDLRRRGPHGGAGHPAAAAYRAAGGAGERDPPPLSRRDRAGRRLHRQSSLPGLPEPRDRRHGDLAGVRRRAARRLHRQHRAQAGPRRQGAGHQQRRRHRPVPGGPADPAAEDSAPRRGQRRRGGADLRQYPHAGSHLGRHQGAGQHQHLWPRASSPSCSASTASTMCSPAGGAGWRSARPSCARRSPRCRTGATARRPTISTTTASISPSRIASRPRSRSRATRCISSSTATRRRAGRSTCGPACRAISSSAW